MKSIFIALLLVLNLNAQSFDVSEFESDIFSKNSKSLKKISITLHMEGDDMQVNTYKITDALNIIISSFYLEDLFTSKGKEQFKTSFTKYLSQKYKIKTDEIYILSIKRINDIPDIDKLVEALKANGCCKSPKSVKDAFESVDK